MSKKAGKHSANTSKTKSNAFNTKANKARSSADNARTNGAKSNTDRTKTNSAKLDTDSTQQSNVRSSDNAVKENAVADAGTTDTLDGTRSNKAAHARHSSAAKDTKDGTKPASPLLDEGLPPKKKERNPAILLLSLLLCVLVVIGGYGVFQWADMNSRAAKAQIEYSEQDIPEVNDEVDDHPKNPIDFSTVQEEHPDAYAWIYIPNTNINLPVMQHPTDDNYYLTHASDGVENFIGELYSQSHNSKDFSDPVTLIYGHNLPDYDLMFTELHYFEDESFFDSNDTFYIYTPDSILTYSVIAEYEYDDRHILNSFDFSDPGAVQGYFDSVLAPESDISNVRDGSALDASQDTIVQLSTCTNPADPAKRYIVTGKLIDRQQTA